MTDIKVKAPAKINLTLEITGKRPDGYHNIESIMQTVSLYDYITFHTEKTEGIKIVLTCNSKDIPCDESNLVYKAAMKFFEKTEINNILLKADIEKNIPVAAGLAGGSTDAAAAIYALNKIFGNILSNEDIENLCSSLGSDINFCYHGGCRYCTSRGEITQEIPFVKKELAIIKPIHVAVSTKEAYASFSALNDKSCPDNTKKLKELMETKKIIDPSLLYNGFEAAILPKYKELQYIKSSVKNSLMSGSGSAFFVLKPHDNINLDPYEYTIYENLETTESGAEEADE